MDRNARRFGFRLERRLRSIKKKDFNHISHRLHLLNQIHHQPLRAALEKEPTEALIARYEALRTPHNTTDYDTRQRLIRALEIAIYEESHPVTRTAFLPKRTKFIGISVTRDERNACIDRRLDARLQEGLKKSAACSTADSHRKTCSTMAWNINS